MNQSFIVQVLDSKFWFCVHGVIDVLIPRLYLGPCNNLPDWSLIDRCFVENSVLAIIFMGDIQVISGSRKKKQWLAEASRY